jgi:hypothetical protein
VQIILSCVKHLENKSKSNPGLHQYTVNIKYFTDPPENVILTLRRKGDNVTITCNAEAHPAPSFKMPTNYRLTIKAQNNL